MGDVIKLKAFRKAQERETREAEAAANRLKFGQTKSQKQLQKREAERATKAIDSHKRED
jgi:hypothetical protein